MAALRESAGRFLFLGLERIQPSDEIVFPAEGKKLFGEVAQFHIPASDIA